ncbi:hypothetical protein FAGKG844_60076 [Frankia sp. AgKG'84/4]
MTANEAANATAVPRAARLKPLTFIRGFPFGPVPVSVASPGRRRHDFWNTSPGRSPRGSPLGERRPR